MSSRVTINLSLKEQKNAPSPREVLGDALNSLCKINESLHRLPTSCPEKNRKPLMKALQTLKDIDREFCRLLEIDSNDGLESNFGLSLKVELQREKLEDVENKLENLRKEWYLQEEHIGKIASQLRASQKELDYQSIYAIHQSMVLAKILWKTSRFNTALECWAANIENHTENIMLVVDACIYALVKIFEDDIPNKESDEFVLVLALCGLVSNLSSIPDGRYFIANSALSQRAYDTMIWSLPCLSTPQTDDLKYVMLISIHNLLINEKGIEYAKNQKHLVENLSVCLMPPHPIKIVGLVLHILRTLIEEIKEPMYNYNFVKAIPFELLQNICVCNEDSPIGQDAKYIIEQLIQTYEAIKSRMEESAKVECTCNKTGTSKVRLRTKIIRKKRSSATSESSATSITVSSKTSVTRTSTTSGEKLETSASSPAKLGGSATDVTDDGEASPPPPPPPPPEEEKTETESSPSSRKSSLSTKGERKDSSPKRVSISEPEPTAPPPTAEATPAAETGELEQCECPCGQQVPKSQKLQVEELYRNENTMNKE